tara:strand:+ start:1118 stop:1681 length:564 start_codon:yes stop_codon:yes gene_type:complete
MIHQIFPTQIATYDLNLDKELIYSVMKDYNVGLLKVLDGGTTSYARGSATDYFLSDGRLTNLIRDIYSKLNDYTNTLYLEPCEIAASWFNKMDSNGSVRQHRHTGSVVSGALYVDAPKGSSPLVFSDPLDGCRMMELCSANNFHYEVDIYEGLLVLFPSWLQHETFPQHQPRTVISFNTYHALTPSF